jgi:hypothetical protein
VTLLVSVADTKARLRITHDAEDADLEMMIHGASAAVMNYLGVTEAVFQDSDYASSSEVVGSSDSESEGTGLSVPPEVELAVMVMVGILARDRDGVEMADWEHGYLPKPVIALLYPLRDPALG